MLTIHRMPLYHFTTTDLPAETMAPEMSDVNVAKALRNDAAFTGEDLSSGSGPTMKIIGNYCDIPCRHWFLTSTCFRSRGKTTGDGNPGGLESGGSESGLAKGWWARCCGVTISTCHGVDKSCSFFMTCSYWNQITVLATTLLRGISSKEAATGTPQAEFSSLSCPISFPSQTESPSNSAETF